MDVYTACEEAYKKGYEDGVKDSAAHAHWEEVEDAGGSFWGRYVIRCGNCGEDADEKTSYCPHCGAKMEE